MDGEKFKKYFRGFAIVAALALSAFVLTACCLHTINGSASKKIINRSYMTVYKVFAEQETEALSIVIDDEGNLSLKKEKKFVGITATGFAINYNIWKRTAFYVTAGHVCTNKARNVRLMNVEGEKIPAKVVDFKMDNNNDYCLLESDLPDSKFYTVKFLEGSPSSGDKIFYIGAPAGYFPSRYDGYLSYLDTSRNVYITSMLVYPGASGSPVFDSRGFVVGMVIEVDGRFFGASVIENGEKIQKFLAKNKAYIYGFSWHYSK